MLGLVATSLYTFNVEDRLRQKSEDFGIARKDSTLSDAGFRSLCQDFVVGNGMSGGI